MKLIQNKNWGSDREKADCTEEFVDEPITRAYFEEAGQTDDFETCNLPMLGGWGGYELERRVEWLPDKN